LKSTEIPINATQTAEARSGITPFISPFNGNILFSAPDNPDALHTDLRWEAGDSELSFYTLAPNEIHLTAGPHTWPNFPTIYHKYSVEGDFEVQTKVTFPSPATRISAAQMVGLLVRPVNARLVAGDSSFPENWVVTAKYITDAGSLVGCRGSWIDFSSDTVYIKIERYNNVWRCAYSKNGENWTRLHVDVDAELLINDQLEIGLFAYSTTDDSITVEFSEWQITEGGNTHP